jgi:hypothetical protein
MNRLKLLQSAAFTGLIAGPAFAADIAVSVEVPRLSVAEYHNPYIAFWLENAEGAHVKDLSVWYDTSLANEEGETWLKDVRQWWRRSGRALDLPVDGLSRPTRAPGEHDMTFDAAALGDLAPGQYTLVVEAMREVGGREQLEIPFTWPPAQSETLSAQGETELGAIALTVNP